MAEHSQNLSEKKVWGLEVPSSWSCVHAAGTCRQRQGWWSNLASFQLIQDSDLSWQCLQELSHWEAAMSGAVMLNLEITPQGTSVKTVPLKPASMVPTTSPEWYLPAHLPVWALGWPDPVSRPAGREFFFFFFCWAEQRFHWVAGAWSFLSVKPISWLSLYSLLSRVISGQPVKVVSHHC